MRHRGREKWIAGAGIFALAVVFFLVWRFGFLPDVVSPAPIVEEIARYRHPLTGMPLQMPTDLPFVYGVMIDQSVEAWPQSGGDKAFLVIEAPVEAGIPRWEAFFYDGQEAVAKIGPVRSARPYFIDWNNELDGLYAHVGGSDAALKRIASDGTYDLNQFWNEVFFWRSKERQAPHNVYTSTELLKKALTRAEETKRVQRPVYGVWTFKKDTPSGQSFGSAIRYASDTYAVQWTYRAGTNSYERTKPSGSLLELRANNVVVIETSVQILDEVGRREVKTVGDGKAMVLQDGRVISVTWKKPSVTERLQFFTEAGDEITMNAGVTWIEVVESLDNQMSVLTQ